MRLIPWGRYSRQKNCLNNLVIANMDCLEILNKLTHFKKLIVYKLLSLVVLVIPTGRSNNFEL